MSGPSRFTPRSVYLHLVCLSMLLVGIFATVQLVRSAMAIAYPDPTPSFSWTAYTPMDMLSGDQQLELQTDVQRRDAIRDAVAAGTALLLAGGIYALHWRRAQAERAAPASTEVPAAPPAP
ncbi:hypothetical protein SAMN05660748_0152 [Blastococcus aggregatus]|uniref:Uncharacterized protein n=1 Tax=Blastococcus aggregatus TaxID=38502 RepID=A0A285UWK4_9ACTN|nr:hypothetical protein [Blastococcus aggregatus]SOC46295.1 hypothetical protein SAMN05660748_0152 [Blastococcus aggregatus]